MKNQKNLDIILTKEEIAEIFSRAFEALKSPDLTSFPVIFFSIWVERIKQKALNKIGDEYDKAYTQFKKEVEKAAKDFDHEVTTAFDKFLQQ